MGCGQSILKNQIIELENDIIKLKEDNNKKIEDLKNEKRILDYKLQLLQEIAATAQLDAAKSHERAEAMKWELTRRTPKEGIQQEISWKIKDINEIRTPRNVTSIKKNKNILNDTIDLNPTILLLPNKQKKTIDANLSLSKKNNQQKEITDSNPEIKVANGAEAIKNGTKYENGLKEREQKKAEEKNQNIDDIQSFDDQKIILYDSDNEMDVDRKISNVNITKDTKEINDTNR